ncbi:MAG: hypothetical protein WCK74_05140 [Gemmatimonadaceae bacterium]
MNRHPGTAPRRGTAILIALVALVVLAILSTGAVMSATQEFRAGRNSLVEQRAMAVAEYGLNQQVAGWTDPSTLARITALTVGGIDSSSRYAVNGDSARVYVTRLSTINYLVSAVGRAGIGNAQLEAQRQTQLLMKVVAATTTTLRPPAVMSVNGRVKVEGSASISGTNSAPSGWTDCPPADPASTFAIAYPAGSSPEIQKPQNVTGGTVQTASAADSSTYTVFGGITWAALVARANVTIAGGTRSPSPVGSASTCTPTSSNWGEPRRASGSVVGCERYFPVVYVTGDVEIPSGRGQGILLVNGKLKVKGNFTWVGLIVVRQELDQENGPFSLTGAILNRNTSRNETELQGNVTLTYSTCALDAVLGVPPAVSRVSQRSWVQRF